MNARDHPSLQIPLNEIKLSLLAAGILAAFQAHSQPAANASEASLKTVAVPGQASIIRKPDINAAEALARMAGSSMQLDQRKRGYVSVRGLGPDVNTVNTNGALVPAPENGRRGCGVSLDVLPAGLVRSLEVSKTLTPEMDANSLDGAFEVKTLSAFDLPRQIFSVNDPVPWPRLPPAYWRVAIAPLQSARQRAQVVHGPIVDLTCGSFGPFQAAVARGSAAPLAVVESVAHLRQLRKVDLFQALGSKTPA